MVEQVIPDIFRLAIPVLMLSYILGAALALAVAKKGRMRPFFVVTILSAGLVSQKRLRHVYSLYQAGTWMLLTGFLLEGLQAGETIGEGLEVAALLTIVPVTLILLVSYIRHEAQLAAVR